MGLFDRVWTQRRRTDRGGSNDDRLRKTKQRRRRRREIRRAAKLAKRASVPMPLVNRRDAAALLVTMRRRSA